MEDNSEIVKCNNCGVILDVRTDEPYDKRTPCPVCGSISRKFEVVVHSTMVLSDSLGMKAKHKDEKKPFIEQLSGIDVCHKNGKRMHKTRIIDRENDLYHETIKDPKTGEVIHECKEPLSKHIGHGDAKPKKII